MLDDTWDSFLNLFAHDPAAAFCFAQILFALKKTIESGPEGSLRVVKVLEEGIEKLFPLTDSHHAAYNLYLLGVEGKLLPEHDPTLIIREVNPIEPESGK